MRWSRSPHRIWAAFVTVGLVLALVTVPSSGAAPDRGSFDATARPLIRNSGQAYLNTRLPIKARVEDPFQLKNPRELKLSVTAGGLLKLCSK